MLGSSLFHARKRAGVTQEEVAERLGVSRQTIGKWEADETLPDIRQSKRLATLYGVALDDLIEFDLDVSQVEEAIERSTEELEEKIDWTSAWAKKVPHSGHLPGRGQRPPLRPPHRPDARRAQDRVRLLGARRHARPQGHPLPGLEGAQGQGGQVASGGAAGDSPSRVGGGMQLASSWREPPSGCGERGEGIASLPYSYIFSSLMNTVRSSSTASNPEREKNPYR